MIAYSVDYEVKGKSYWSVLVEGRDFKSVKKKLGKKHGYDTGRMIKVKRASVVGYF